MKSLAFPKRIEEGIQNRLIAYLRIREWVVKATHGNAYQSGFPDLFATHRLYGTRFIEVKQATQFSFTKAQLQDFPQLVANGCSIWVLVDATDEEYAKLFKQCNFLEFLMCHNDGKHNIHEWRPGR